MGSTATVADINSENIAEHFTPEVPMKPAGMPEERARHWQDVPKDVASMIKNGLLNIGNTCLKPNAKLILEIYEEACLNHVVAMQIKDKTFSALVRGNLALERANPALQKPSKGSIVKSSLLGQDPFGDEPIPLESDGEDEDATYSKVQALLKNIQDQNYGYLTAHLERILHENIMINVRNEEAKYKDDVGGRRSRSSRNRMPWHKYKSIIYELLPEQTGLHELRILATFNREDGESAQSWIQRITEAKRLLEKYGIVLPDKVYVKIAVDYLSGPERAKIAERVGPANQRAKKTKQKLLREIFDLSFDKLSSLVTNALETNSHYWLSKKRRLVKQLVFTRQQVHLFFGTEPKKQRTKPEKRKRAENPREKLAVKCKLCTEAGLKGRRVNHRTEDCKTEVREKAVRRMKEHQRRKSGNVPGKKRPNSGAQPRAPKRRAAQEFKCDACAKAGRKHRHDPRKCKYAPGGEWHGKTKEELRALQKKYYEQINLSRQEKELTHQIEQLKKRRKLRHDKAKSAGGKDANSPPLWRKETTLIAMQRDYADAENNVPKPTRATSANDENRNSAPPSSDEDTPGRHDADSAEESDSQSEPEVLETPRKASHTPEGDEGEDQSSAEEDQSETEEEPEIGVTVSESEQHPGVVEAEGDAPSGEERREPLGSPKSDSEDDHPKASSAKIVPAVDEESEASEKDDESESAPKEVVDLVSSDEEYGTEPMTQEEFLRKRASIRRGEWTRAHNLPAEESNESDADSEEEEEPVMHKGPTFRGPPLCGPLRAESLSVYLENMRRYGATEAEVAARKRQITPVCFMMNESSEADKEMERPAKALKPPSPEEEEEDALFLVTPCDQSGTPLPPGDAHHFPLYLDEPVKYMMRDLRELFPLRPGRWMLTIAGKRLKASDTPNSLGIGNREAVEVKLLMKLQPRYPTALRDPRLERDQSDQSMNEEGAAAAEACTWPTIPSLSEHETTTAEQKSYDDKDMSLEVWWGTRRYATIQWQKHKHMKKMMLALSRVFSVQNCHIILRTQLHVLSGVGCIVGTDTPHSLSMHDGDIINVCNIPDRVQITSHFTPSLVVAERMLKISAFEVRSDEDTYERGTDSVGSVYEDLSNIREISTSKITVNRKTSIKFSQNNSTQKRKNSSPAETDVVKRRKNSKTSTHNRRHVKTTLGEERSEMTESTIDTPMKDMTQRGEKSGCDNENSQFSRLQYVRMGTPVARSERDQRTHIDFKGVIDKITKERENPSKSGNFTRTPESQSHSPDETSGSESSFSESEDLLKYRNKIRTNLGPIKRSYDPNKTVYTPDMRFPFKKDNTSGSERYRDLTPAVTRDETNPENSSSLQKNLQENDFSPNSLSTKVETSSSNSDTEGSLPKDTTGPQSDSPKEVTMVTKQNKKKRKSQKQRRTDKKRQMYSETKRYRLLQVYLSVMDKHGKIRRIKAALDTQSNVSYSKDYLGQKRPWRPHESSVVKGVGGYCENGTPLTTYVIKGKDVIPLDTRSPPEHMFQDPGGPEMLLSAQHCDKLSIDLNATLRSMKHQDAKFLDTRNRKKTSRTKKNPDHKCYISEKIMKQYMDKNGGTDKEPKQCTIEDVVIAEDFTPEQKRTVTAILHKYRDVFASSPDDIPPPMKGVEPHVFKMKSDVKPIYCKRPNWGPHQRKFLTLWTKKAIEQGLMEPAPKSQWASRPVIVGKFRGQTAKSDTPDGMRVCVDFTAVNEYIVRQPPQYTDPYEEIRKACGHEYYFEADGQKQFNSIPLAEESRDITTTWTPLGLMRWLRLIMGTKDASGRAQQVYSKCMSKHLTDEERDFIANFQDDFLGFEDDIPSLLRIFEAFLRMCQKSGIMLNPAKIRIGIRKCKFYGFILSKKGMEPSEKNLDPVKKMTIPKNSSEVRSILGVFNQFRHFFKRYDRLVLPLQKLLRKNEPFIWSKEASQGLEIIRAALLSGEMYLAAPDPTVPLVLETDGSDDGWGAILLQIIKGVRRVIKMWSKQWKTLHMKRSPPYYKETAAWMNGLEKSRIYIDYSPFPVKCITDHIPLTYIKNTSGKGPVSQFVLDNLSSLDYTIEYRKGTKLVEADAVSRFPCLGPRELSPDGVKEAFNILLAALPNKWTTKGRVWVHAQKETEIIQQLVRQWLSMMTRDKEDAVHRVPYTESVTADRIRKVDYSIALWAPPADNVTQIVNEALTRNLPFACLLPSCLVNLTPDNPQNQKALNETIKIVLLTPEVTWILHKVDSIHQHQVYTSWLDMNTFGNEEEHIHGIVRPPPKWNFKEWSVDQEKMLKNFPKLYPKNKIHRRASDGFVTFTLTKDSTVALVPKKYRTQLINWQHLQLCHAGDIKVHNALKQHWYWPDLKKDTRTVVRNCAACQLLKAKRARAHRHFRAKVFCTPRTSWGCDFYGVAESTSGHNNILGAIDLATAECRLFACKNRSAEVVMNCLLHGIVLRDGCPLHIHSDAAREFLSKAMRRLCEIVGCKQTTTLAHHPTGNSTIERLWQYVALCLKLMSKIQYQKWERFIRLMEHVWNTTFHSVLQCTPFEAAHGLPARTVLDTHVERTSETMGDLMTTDGVEAMKQTAKAFEKQIYQLRKEAAERRATLARKGSKLKYEVGDEVSLYIPPSEQEAKQAGRKVKHLLYFRGPAVVTQVLSNTSYKLDYNGRVYYRCFAELRPYRSSGLPGEFTPTTYLKP